MREVLEETGLDIEDVQFLTATNDVMPQDGKHYVTVFVGARVKDNGKVPEVCNLPFHTNVPLWRQGINSGDDR